MTSAVRTDLLTSLLRDVSRSFYLTLRLLPTPVRPQIGLAYLLARATDTIADTELLPLDERLGALAALRDRILGNRTEPIDLGRLAENQALPAERVLLHRVEEAIGILGGLACFDRCCIRTVLEMITGGQELDLRRFHGAAAGRIVALADGAELDDYTYRVAGCVGGFWTRLCRSHLYPQAALDVQGYVDDAIRFGKGLQMVNILRDLPGDLRKGRCYVPAEDLADAGLTPETLLDPGSMSRFRGTYRELLAQAAEHLAAGWRYTCTTPRNQRRVRLACALPLLIGADTLRLLAGHNVLDPARRLKVTRARVRSLLLRAVVFHPFPRTWERLFDPRLPVNGVARG
jgi:farnesyl-diphosphate farnesyltransferase